ncbi:unnamed protein product [Hymenolepis diminuta]|uniref:Uncharacterized protein n=1 Tax=Hymenolepis diminuta TaxID=6216 RepID=A0A0R3SKY0_HYMDI|nr:unnamed protein product [Hymenolepis diminuta]
MGTERADDKPVPEDEVLSRETRDAKVVGGSENKTMSMYNPAQPEMANAERQEKTEEREPPEQTNDYETLYQSKEHKLVTPLEEVEPIQPPPSNHAVQTEIPGTHLQMATKATPNIKDDKLPANIPRPINLCGKGTILYSGPSVGCCTERTILGPIYLSLQPSGKLPRVVGGDGWILIGWRVHGAGGQGGRIWVVFDKFFVDILANIAVTLSDFLCYLHGKLWWNPSFSFTEKLLNE